MVDPLQRTAAAGMAVAMVEDMATHPAVGGNPLGGKDLSCHPGKRQRDLCRSLLDFNATSYTTALLIPFSTGSSLDSAVYEDRASLILPFHDSLDLRQLSSAQR